ncbi:MAG: hypothetical protein FWF96_03335 [Kiritimatiellaeota bacterium]|nr:hypothetical protein [Kiritimatiellota bacterium]
MKTLEKFELTPFGPYRFIGKSVYARAGGFCVTTQQSGIFGGLWKNSGWIFETLDGLSEHATDEIHDIALLTWEKFEDKSQLLGYTVGRFMKPGTPVPAGMDYFDIEATFVGKGWVKSDPDAGLDFHLDIEQLTKDAINQQNYYETGWKWFAEVYPQKSAVHGGPLMGLYMSCAKK